VTNPSGTNFSAKIRGRKFENFGSTTIYEILLSFNIFAMPSVWKPPVTSTANVLLSLVIFATVFSTWLVMSRGGRKVLRRGIVVGIVGVAITFLLSLIIRG
jgi:hypothetical protein